jgi:hypothetical protein
MTVTLQPDTSSSIPLIHGVTASSSSEKRRTSLVSHNSAIYKRAIAMKYEDMNIVLWTEEREREIYLLHGRLSTCECHLTSQQDLY